MRESLEKQNSLTSSDSEGLMDKLVEKFTSVLPWKPNESEIENSTPKSAIQAKRKDMIKSKSQGSERDTMVSLERIFESVTLPWSSDNKGITLLKHQKSADKPEHGSGLSISSAKHRSRSPSPTNSAPRQRSHTMDPNHGITRNNHHHHKKVEHLQRPTFRKQISENGLESKADSAVAAAKKESKSTGPQQHKKKVLDMRHKYHMDTPEMQRARDLGKAYGLSTSHDLLGAPDSRNEANGEMRHMAKSQGHLDQLRQSLNERGEKVSEIEDRTDNMKHVAGEWSSNMNKIADKYKKKKWYEL